MENFLAEINEWNHDIKLMLYREVNHQLLFLDNWTNVFPALRQTKSTMGGITSDLGTSLREQLL